VPYVIHNDLAKEEELVAREKLTEFNLPFAGPPNFSEVGLALRDKAGALHGALYGSIVWDWFHINVLWVAEQLRGKGHGGMLLQHGEKVAAERDCRYIKLHTFSFQARPFYEAHGYRVIAETPDFPPGHAQYLMFKDLGVRNSRPPASSDDSGHP